MIEDLGKNFKSETGELSTRLSELEKRAAREPANDNHGAADFASVLMANRDFAAGFDFQARSRKRYDIGGGLSEAMATITSMPSTVGNNTSAGTSLVPGHRHSEIVRPAERELTIRDLFAVIPTTSSNYEYTREEEFTNNARPQTEGETKGQSDLTFELETVPIRTLAHFFKASKQIIDDTPGLAEYIGRRGMRGLKVLEETQLLFGDGTGQNLSGLVPQAASFSTALLKAGDNREIDVVRRAIQQVRRSEHFANGIVVHPDTLADWQLTKDDEKRYIMGSPVNSGAATLWGLPVVATSALDAGDFIVGAFGSAAAIIDRQQAIIELSSEADDDFTRNRLTIRIEERLGLAVFQPLAFVTGSFEDALAATSG